MAVVELFWSFFKVGAFALGGGYVLIPLIRRQVVEIHSWLKPEEFLEILGVTQGLPGAISVKMATYTGYKVAGIPGVVAANLGNVAVPLFLILVLFGVLTRLRGWVWVDAFLTGVRIGTWALLLGLGVALARETAVDVRALLVAVPAFAAIAFLRVDPALAVVYAGLAGVVLFR